MSQPDYNLDNYDFAKKAWLRIRSDWKLFAAKAWSVRLMLVAGLLAFMQVVFPAIGVVLPIPDIAVQSIQGLIVAGALVSQFVVQKDIGIK